MQRTIAATAWGWLGEHRCEVREGTDTVKRTPPEVSLQPRKKADLLYSSTAMALSVFPALTPALYPYHVSGLSQCHVEVAIVTTPGLQMRKLRYREVAYLAQSLGGQVGV